LSLVGVHLLAYTFGGLFIPMTAIVGIWGFIHTGGFLIGQTRSTSEAPEAPELAASLMVSFGNAGVTLGTFLGGIIITSFGIHQVIFISILLLLVALALTYVFVGKKRLVKEDIEQKQAGEERVFAPEEPVLEV
jgi:MFS transporter, DHA1 family, inner membrane transport protein